MENHLPLLVPGLASSSSSTHDDLTSSSPDTDQFGKDGDVTQALEEVPIVGFVQSVRHVTDGDYDRALRAAAKCSSSTIHAATMLAVNVATGGLGVLPTLAVGAAAGGIGLVSEMAIKKCIADPDVSDHLSEGSSNDMAVSAWFGSALAMVGGAGGALAKSVVGELGGKALARHASGFISGQAANQVHVAPVKRDVKRRLADIDDDVESSRSSQIRPRHWRKCMRMECSPLRDPVPIDLARPRRRSRRLSKRSDVGSSSFPQFH